MAEQNPSILTAYHIKKSFQLPHEKRNSLKERVINLKRKRTFEKLEALKDISFEIKKGEFFGILGRNGSGKSTLLKIIAGIYQPTKGHIDLRGSLTPFIELGIGFNPELTGKENVYLNGAILGLTRREVETKYEEIVQFAELEKFMDQKLKNYSSGMQVRLAFSIAMQAHNDILLIDEVLAVGDASFQRKSYEAFKNIKAAGEKTVIFVSHDMAAVRDFCDQAILIENGEIVSRGKADKVANDYLQLFNKEAMKESKSGEGNDRWGDFKAEISNVDIKVSKESIDVSFKVKAKEQINNPIYGLIIKDLDNHHIFDSNTKWKHISTGSLDKGEQANVGWQIPNVFKNGKYNLTVAAAHADGFGFYDWQDGVKYFSVNREEVTAGFVVLDDKISIKSTKVSK